MSAAVTSSSSINLSIPYLWNGSEANLKIGKNTVNFSLVMKYIGPFLGKKKEVPNIILNYKYVQREELNGTTQISMYFFKSFKTNSWVARFDKADPGYTGISRVWEDGVLATRGRYMNLEETGKAVDDFVKFASALGILKPVGPQEPAIPQASAIPVISQPSSTSASPNKSEQMKSNN